MAQPILCVLFGGKSNEHDVSLLSAAAILRELDRQRIPRLALYLDRDGRPFVYRGDSDAVGAGSFAGDPSRLFPADLVWGGVLLRAAGGFLPLSGVIPAVHGGTTEDGRLQGMLDLLGVPYAGSGAEACAVAMNKALCKTVLSAAGIPVAGGFSEIVCSASDTVGRVEQTLGYPVFVKPARSGSSIGAGAAHDRRELTARIEAAAKTDRLVLFEPLIRGREIEVGILEDENGAPVASPPGELFFDAGFYDYETKYGVGAQTVIPADLSPSLTERIRELALLAFRTLGCRGYARVDFFVSEGEPILNEVNALPGLTDKSVFPRLAHAMGVPFPALVRRLAAFATEGSA